MDPAPTEGSAVLCSDFACTLALKWFVLDGQNALLTSLCTNFPMTVQSNPAMPNLEARWKDPKKLDATIDQELAELDADSQNFGKAFLQRHAAIARDLSRIA